MVDDANAIRGRTRAGTNQGNTVVQSIVAAIQVDNAPNVTAVI